MCFPINYKQIKLNKKYAFTDTWPIPMRKTMQCMIMNSLLPLSPYLFPIRQFWETTESQIWLGSFSYNSLKNRFGKIPECLIFLKQNKNGSSLNLNLSMLYPLLSLFWKKLFVFFWPELDTSKRKKVLWLGDNTPYVSLGIKIFQCHHGRDKNKKRAERRKEVNIRGFQFTFCGYCQIVLGNCRKGAESCS